MKTSNPKSRFNFVRRVDPCFAVALILVALWCGAVVRAEGAEANRPVAAPHSDSTNQPAAPSAQKEASSQPSAEVLSPVVGAVIKLADANVSAAIIKTYVECSPPAEPPTETDIIALKKHNVPDEIVTILLNQGAKTRALDAQRRNEAVARALAARNARFGGLDPESYEYFQYYYLQPRALASVHQRLSPYYGPWGFHSYGPPPAFGFRHHGYGRPRY